MKIKNFISDRPVVEARLSKLVASLEADDHIASYRFHPGSNGFGLFILAAPRSGELHLFQDGRLTMRIEHGIREVENVSRPVAHLGEFEDIVQAFQLGILAPI